MDKLVAQVSDLSAGYRLILGLIALASFIAATVMMVAIDRLWPAWTGLGQMAAIIIGLVIWLRLVEEPELTERFGDGYPAYRRKVPAFWPRVQNCKKFFRFLITGQDAHG
jgi:steroid 5-alpha reductase family enzyme